MEKIALNVGAWLCGFGIVSVVVKLFPPNGGALAIAGAIIFGAGVVSKAIAGRK